MASPHWSRGWVKATGGRYLKTFRDGTRCVIKKIRTGWDGDCSARGKKPAFGCSANRLIQTKRCVNKMHRDLSRSGW